MIRVVPAGNRVVVRAEFRVLLEEHDDITAMGETAGGRRVAAVVIREHPDVVCINLRMPAGDGLTVTWQIVAPRQDGSSAVLVVATFDLDADVFDALEAGADEFTPKDCEPEELIDVVRHFAAGYGLVDHTVAHQVIAEFVRRHASAGDTTETWKLMVRELETMKLLTAGMLGTEITTGLVVGTSTVKSYLTRILPKTGAGDRVQAVVWAYRSGLAE